MANKLNDVTTGAIPVPLASEDREYLLDMRRSFLGMAAAISRRLGLEPRPVVCPHCKQQFRPKGSGEY